LKKDEYEFLLQYRELKRKAHKHKHKHKENPEEDFDTMIVTSELSQSIEDIVKEYGIDESLWEAVAFEPGNWTTPVKTKFFSELEKKDGKSVKISAVIPVMVENRKSKAKFEKKTSIIDYKKFRSDLIEDLKKFSPKVKLDKVHKIKSGNLLEVNIPDLHLGKLSWAEETGVRNYDVKTAIMRFKLAFNEMLSEALTSSPVLDEILFIVGNDLFNSDNAYPFTQTTAGTPQQDDVRWQKVFREGRQLMIETILKLSSIAPVKVKVVPGNHDFQKSFYLGDVLEAYFDGNENVEVDNSPRTRKYHIWGKCLIGFAHGSRKDEGEARLLNNMKHECAKEWGETIYREWHCGDIHHYKEMRQRERGNGEARINNLDKYAEDIDGIVIKYLRTLMFNDEWEAKKGYISQKGAHMFIWNKEGGNTHEFKFNRYD